MEQEEDLKKLAKTYFVLFKNKNNMKYVGPKNEYQKWYYILNKEHKNLNSKNWRIKNLEYDKLRTKNKGYIFRFTEKLQALRKVSNSVIPKCSICGNEDIRVLTINHINGDGAIERNINKSRVSRIYRDILKGRKILDLDVRCYNCNILYEYETGRRKLPLNYKELYGT